MNKEEVKRFLEELYLLQDLDLLIDQIIDPAYLQTFGFKVSEEKVEALKQKREEVAGKLRKVNPRWLQAYERLRKKYKRGIARVVDGICTNCFVHLPASMNPYEVDTLPTCPSCGIILIWMD
jgi:predicted  nucleic acid-binding Zn-ribbon protein